MRSLSDGERGIAGAAAGGAGALAADAVVGLERAAQRAGDVLRDAIGALPWGLGGDVAELVSAIVLGGIA